jgi:hypothetical protein
MLLDIVSLSPLSIVRDRLIPLFMHLQKTREHQWRALKREIPGKMEIKRARVARRRSRKLRGQLGVRPLLSHACPGASRPCHLRKNPFGSAAVCGASSVRQSSSATARGSVGTVASAGGPPGSVVKKEGTANRLPDRRGSTYRKVPTRLGAASWRRRPDRERGSASCMFSQPLEKTTAAPLLGARGVATRGPPGA